MGNPMLHAYTAGGRGRSAEDYLILEKSHEISPAGHFDLYCLTQKGLFEIFDIDRNYEESCIIV